MYDYECKKYVTFTDIIDFIRVGDELKIEDSNGLDITKNTVKKLFIKTLSDEDISVEEMLGIIRQGK